jgi:uncharacterized membrane protein
MGSATEALGAELPRGDIASVVRTSLVARLRRVGWVLVGLQSLVAVNLVLGHYGTSGPLQDRILELLAGAEYTSIQFPKYAQHPSVSFMHFVPGLAFVFLGPLQFIPSLRARRPRLHRAIGYAFIAVTATLSASGLLIAFGFPYVPFAEAVPTAFYSTITAVGLVMAIVRIRQRRIQKHREWMLRVFAMGLGIANARGYFLIFLYLTRVPSSQFFGTIFWLGTGTNLLLAEIWINLTREERGRPAIRINRESTA